MFIFRRARWVLRRPKFPQSNRCATGFKIIMGTKPGYIARKTLDMVGKRFGKLIILEIISDPYGKTKAKCKCDCGAVKVILHNSIKSGRTESCGCLLRLHQKIGSIKHGMRRTGEYLIWAAMKSRIFNKNNKKYFDYGGRGLNMQESWKERFDQFYADMGPRPDGLEIERKDNDVGYFKSNCYWATRKQEMNNTRANVKVEFCGVIKNLIQWSEEYGVPYNTIYYRYCIAGWTIERALKTPVITPVRKQTA